MTINDNSIQVYESVEEWQEEARRRFGGDFLKWKFVCPMCGHVASIGDFKEAGADSPDAAYKECIGRYTGKGSPQKGDSSGCNWCAYGLLGIPKGGALVKNGEYYQHVFDFAEEK